MGLERKAVWRAASAHTVHYERRRPEETILHCLVREQLETFLAQVEAKTGAGLPEFVKDEFDAFLECGILAHGFLRVRCADCAHEKLVAFSCKRRGFCPSCGARRMAEGAAHLVDQVIPRVPVRQWVLSFPIPLRILFAAHPELLTPVLRIVHRVIAGFLLRQAGLKRTTADTGAVTLIQRFGSVANLNIHLHCLVLDGDYRRTEGEPVFEQARAPSRDELDELLERIVERLLKMLRHSGYLGEEEGMSYLADLDPDNPLTPLQAASCTYRIAFGPRAGQKVLGLNTTRFTAFRPGDTIARRAKRRFEFPIPTIDLAEVSLEGVMEDNPDHRPDRTAMRSELRGLMEGCIDALPEACRTVFMLRAVEELSVEEVSAALGLPEATVRTRYFRARGLLREGLARDIDHALADAFSFDGARCDRIVATVMARLNDAADPVHS